MGDEVKLLPAPRPCNDYGGYCGASEEKPDCEYCFNCSYSGGEAVYYLNNGRM